MKAKKITAGAVLALSLAAIPLANENTVQTSRTNEVLLFDGVGVDMPIPAVPKHRRHDPCRRSADITLQASLTAARADYFETVAACVHRGGNLWKCMRNAYGDYRDATKLARAQYKERLALCKMLGKGPYNPDLDPDDFTTKVTNKYYPLPVGRTMVYRKKTAEEDETITVTVLKDVFEIEGIECVTIRDVVEDDGELIEDTLDWYAQDKKGNVWYMGEIARNYEDGMLADLGGSWRFGLDGALPGILMKASPKVGDVYRQEFLLNEAEDVGRVVSFGHTVKVPAGTFKNCMKTTDWTPLEPGNVENKFYAPGVGTVLEVDPDGGRTELVKIIDPK